MLVYSWLYTSRLFRALSFVNLDADLTMALCLAMGVVYEPASQSTCTVCPTRPAGMPPSRYSNGVLLPGAGAGAGSDSSSSTSTPTGAGAGTAAGSPSPSTSPSADPTPSTVEPISGGVIPATQPSSGATSSDASVGGGAIAGIVIAAIAGAVLLGLCCWCICRKSRRPTRGPVSSGYRSEPGSDYYSYYNSSESRHTAGSRSPRFGLRGGGGRHVDGSEAGVSHHHGAARGLKLLTAAGSHHEASHHSHESHAPPRHSGSAYGSSTGTSRSRRGRFHAR